MLVAFSISDVSNQLGTGVYISTQKKVWLTPQLLPFILFVISAFIAFSTGTSWGTFAIMMDQISFPKEETNKSICSFECEEVTTIRKTPSDPEPTYFTY